MGEWRGRGEGGRKGKGIRTKGEGGSGRAKKGVRSQETDFGRNSESKNPESRSSIAESECDVE